jgi:hypothetical protein
MAVRLLETTKVPRVRGAWADIWNTVSAWIWTSYLLLIAGAFAWWAL